MKTIETRINEIEGKMNEIAKFESQVKLLLSSLKEDMVNGNIESNSLKVSEIITSDTEVLKNKSLNMSLADFYEEYFEEHRFLENKKRNNVVGKIITWMHWMCIRGGFSNTREPKQYDHNGISKKYTVKDIFKANNPNQKYRNFGKKTEDFFWDKAGQAGITKKDWEQVYKDRERD